MTYRGHVKNGAVVLDEEVPLPEGAAVAVEVLAAERAAEKEESPPLHDGLDGLIGVAKGLPSDLARNHDHYLYGRPKK